MQDFIVIEHRGLEDGVVSDKSVYYWKTKTKPSKISLAWLFYSYNSEIIITRSSELCQAQTSSRTKKLTAYQLLTAVKLSQ